METNEELIGWECLGKVKVYHYGNNGDTAFCYLYAKELFGKVRYKILKDDFTLCVNRNACASYHFSHVAGEWYFDFDE